MKQQQVSMGAAFLSTLLMGIMGGMVLGLGAYVISPIDAIPDVIPIAGQVDDGGAVMLVGLLLYVMQKSGLLGKFMATWREVSGDVNQTIDKAIEEVSK